MVEESRRSEEQKYDKQLKEMRKRLEEQHEQLAKRQTDLEEKQNEANAVSNRPLSFQPDKIIYIL